MTDRCRTCRYFDEYDESPADDDRWEDDDTIGKCKRFPPVLVAQKRDLSVNDWAMPSVRSSDWCGEFAPPPPLDD